MANEAPGTGGQGHQLPALQRRVGLQTPVQGSALQATTGASFRAPVAGTPTFPKPGAIPGTALGWRPLQGSSARLATPAVPAKVPTSHGTAATRAGMAASATDILAASTKWQEIEQQRLKSLKAIVQAAFKGRAAAHAHRVQQLRDSDAAEEEAVLEAVERYMRKAELLTQLFRSDAPSLVHVPTGARAEEDDQGPGAERVDVLPEAEGIKQKSSNEAIRGDDLVSEHGNLMLAAAYSFAQSGLTRATGSLHSNAGEQQDATDRGPLPPHESGEGDEGGAVPRGVGVRKRKGSAWIENVLRRMQPVSQAMLADWVQGRSLSAQSLDQGRTDEVLSARAPWEQWGASKRVLAPAAGPWTQPSRFEAPSGGLQTGQHKGSNARVYNRFCGNRWKCQRQLLAGMERAPHTAQGETLYADQ